MTTITALFRARLQENGFPTRYSAESFDPNQLRASNGRWTVDGKKLIDPNGTVRETFKHAQTAKDNAAFFNQQLEKGSSRSIESFASEVQKLADAAPDHEKFYDNKAFISPLWKASQQRPGFPKMPLEEFKKKLIEANGQRLLDLSRADQVADMNRGLLDDSETNHLNAQFHFVRTEVKKTRYSRSNSGNSVIRKPSIHDYFRRSLEGRDLYGKKKISAGQRSLFDDDGEVIVTKKIVTTTKPVVEEHISTRTVTHRHGKRVEAQHRVLKPTEHWVTLHGRNHGGGGARVIINGEGEITGGHRDFVGKKLSDLFKKKPEEKPVKKKPSWFEENRAASMKEERKLEWADSELGKAKPKQDDDFGMTPSERRQRWIDVGKPESEADWMSKMSWQFLSPEEKELFNQQPEAAEVNHDELLETDSRSDVGDAESGLGRAIADEPADVPVGKVKRTRKKRGSRIVPEGASLVSTGGLADDVAGGDGPASGRGIDNAGSLAASPDRSGSPGTVGDRGSDSGHGSGDGRSFAASVAEEPTVENPTDASAGNWKYQTRDFFEGGVKAKFRKNLEAIRTLREMTEEGRDVATPEEQEKMSQFVGWGSMPGLFNEMWDKHTQGAYSTYNDWARDKDKWGDEREEIKKLLSDDEWEAARKATLNSHFTHPDVVDAHWKMAQKLGFQGGRFLEPSAGIGYYLGMMPPELAFKTHTSAVELDTTTGDLLKKLYPGSHVEVKGFQDHQAPKGFYDLVASNVPFGDYKVHDREYNKHKAAIHDYFFLKSADMTAPGGLVMHVTSTGTMDKADDVIRQELAKTCDFVSAIRFPGSTHKENAGTEVVTDMIVLRKRYPGEKPVTLDYTPPEAIPVLAGVGLKVENFSFNRADVSVKTPYFVGGNPSQVIEVQGKAFIGLDHLKMEYPELAVEIEKRNKDNGAGFTGTTTDSLGRVYHWVDGHRVPGPDWMQTKEVPDPAGGEPIRVNEYFADHPEQVLGTLDRTGTMYRGESVNVSKTDDFEERLQAAIDRLPEGVCTSRDNPTQVKQVEQQATTDDVKDGGYVIRDGKLYKRQGGGETLQTSNGPMLARIGGQLAIRDAKQAVVDAELNGQDSEAERAELNRLYDAYVAKHGPLSNKENRNAMKGDPDAPNLLALEKYDSTTKKARKADMFAKETIRARHEVDHAENTSEGVGVSLNETGGIDPARIAELTGKSRTSVEKDLIESGLAFEDPQKGWSPADQYLSGNVRQKLVMARASAAVDPKYQPNVDALEKVQPEDIDYQEIDVRLGASWVPPSDVQQFAAQLVGVNPNYLTTNYVPETGEWQFSWGRKVGGAQVAQHQTGRKSFDDIMEAILNNKSLSVYDTQDDGSRTFNEVETLAVQEKANEIKEKFREWVWEDDERRARLHRYYNDNFNNIRPIQFNGSHLTFPGMNPDFQMRDIQKNFVWQVITTGRGLAAHEVGTGKTSSAVAAAMELRRLGLAKKPCFCVLKANIEQITKEALELYPGAKILSTSENFDAQNRKKTIAQIATGDYDMVIMTHDNMDLLPMKPAVEAEYIRSELAELEAARELAWQDDPSKTNRIVKALENTKAKLESRLKEAIDRESKDDAVTFEETGIDQIFIDECFPVRTMVETDRGLMTIGEIVEKRLQVNVWSCNRETHEYNWMAVTEWFKRPLRNHLVRVTHENGSFVCTPNHNIWTEENGYVEAGNLSPSHTLRFLQGTDCFGLATAGCGQAREDVLLREGLPQQVAARGPECTANHIGLRDLRGDVCASRKNEREDEEWRSPVLREILHGEMAMVAAGNQSQSEGFDEISDNGRNSQEIVYSYETEQSDCESRNGREDASVLNGQTLQASWRQRSFNGASRAIGSRFGMDDGNGDSYGSCQGNISGSSDVLQSRFRASDFEDCDRGRRPVASDDQWKDSRSEEKRSPVGSRVVSVTLHQRKGDERTVDGDSGDLFVYDIEVGGTHNYFADGVNVSNSHKYKSLPVITRGERIKGVPQGRSDRATNMLMRTRWLMDRNGNRGVVFCTGTPVGNTMAELYNIQRYLQPDELKQRGISNFDSWASAFGDRTTSMEATVTGDYQPVTRFNRFTNIPELMNIAGQVMDVQRADNLKKADGSPVIVRPKRHDKIIATPANDGTRKMMAELQDRAVKCKGQRPEKGADNMAVICSDGRKGSLDLRMLDADAPDMPDSKVNQCVSNVLRLHNSRPETTQLIFSNVGVNPSPETGFHLYADVINKLVAGGIPRDKIADFSKLEGVKREAAQEAMKRGDIVVAIGSTEKLGTGVNVQNRVAALHHLDVPWMPSEIEQRDGRGYRSGNRNDPTRPANDQQLDIYRYVSEGSLDTFMWQIVGNKAHFINQIINGKNKNLRSVTDEDTETLSPEQLMAVASGDPRILQKVQLESDLRELKMSHDRHHRDQSKLRDQAKHYEANVLPNLETTVKAYESDAAHLAKLFKDSEGSKEKPFSMKVNGKTHTDRKEAAEALESRFKELSDEPYYRRSDVDNTIGEYRGFKIEAPHGYNYMGPELRIIGPSGTKYDTRGSLASIEAVMRGIPKIHENESKNLGAYRKDLETIKGNIGKEFRRAGELTSKQKELQDLDKELKAGNHKEPITPAPEEEPVQYTKSAAMTVESMVLRFRSSIAGFLHHSEPRKSRLVQNFERYAKQVVEKAKEHKYSSTQINVPADLAKKLKAMAARIPDEDLAEDGRETEFHITVKYGIHDDTTDDLSPVIMTYPSFPIILGKTSLFENPEADVVKVEIPPQRDVHNLFNLNATINDAVECTTTHPDYEAHITLAYVKPGLGKKYVGMDDVDGERFRAEEVMFSNKKRELTAIPLAGRRVPNLVESFEKYAKIHAAKGQSSLDFESLHPRKEDGEFEKKEESPTGTGRGSKFSPKSAISKGIVGESFTHSVQNDVPVGDGGKVIASQIVEKGNGLFRVSIIENKEGERHSLIEESSDSSGSGAGANTRFTEVPSRELDSRKLESVNKTARSMFDQHKIVDIPSRVRSAEVSSKVMQGGLFSKEDMTGQKGLFDTGNLLFEPKKSKAKSLFDTGPSTLEKIDDELKAKSIVPLAPQKDLFSRIESARISHESNAAPR